MFYLLQEKRDGFCKSDFINIINGGFVNPCQLLEKPVPFQQPHFPEAKKFLFIWIE